MDRAGPLWGVRGRLRRTEADLSRWEEAGATTPPSKAVSWVSFLLLPSEAKREPCGWASAEERVSPLKASAQAEILVSENQLLTGHCFFFFFFFLLHLGAFDNIFEKKDISFSLLHALTFISHYDSKTGNCPLSKTSSTAEAPWLVIRKVKDDLGAFKASAREGGQISAPPVGVCGRL